MLLRFFLTRYCVDCVWEQRGGEGGMEGLAKAMYECVEFSM